MMLEEARTARTWFALSLLLLLMLPLLFRFHALLELFSDDDQFLQIISKLDNPLSG